LPRRPGTVVPCRGAAIAFRYGRDGFLRLRLPNGRRLTYPFARVKTTAHGETVVTFMDPAAGRWVNAGTATAPVAGCGPRTWCKPSLVTFRRGHAPAGSRRLRHRFMRMTKSAPKCRRISVRSMNFLDLHRAASVGRRPADRRQGTRGTRFAKIAKADAALMTEPQDEATPESLAL
jgi:hypothetical protein